MTVEIEFASKTVSESSVVSIFRVPIGRGYILSDPMGSIQGRFCFEQNSGLRM
jgi:hypothetical protein